MEFKQKCSAAKIVLKKVICYKLIEFKSVRISVQSVTQILAIITWQSTVLIKRYFLYYKLKTTITFNIKMNLEYFILHDFFNKILLKSTL